MTPTKILSGVFTVVVLMFGAYSVGSWGRQSVESQYSHAISEWKDERSKVLQYSDSIKKVLIATDNDRAKLSVAVIEKTKQVATLTRTAETLRKRNDKILDSLSNTLPDTCKVALDLATSYRAEADTLRVAVQVLEARDTTRVQDIRLLTRQKSLLITEVDSLKRLVITVPIYAPKKILGFIPMPSRTTTFVVGALAGLATGIYVTR